VQSPSSQSGRVRNPFMERCTRFNIML
jgi:hypothetical protein